MTAEKKKPVKLESGSGGSGFGDIFPMGDTRNATVAHGIYSEELPVAGMTVGEIRAKYSTRFDIDPKATPVIDGKDVNNETILKNGQSLMFTKRAGEKGVN